MVIIQSSLSDMIILPDFSSQKIRQRLILSLWSLWARAIPIYRESGRESNFIKYHYITLSSA